MIRHASIVDTVVRWFDARMQECCRCCDCGDNVSPWEEVCPNCGRGKPARISVSAAVMLIAGCGLLLFLIAVGSWIF